MARAYKPRWKYQKCLRCKYDSTSALCYNCCVELGVWNINRSLYPDKVKPRKPLTKQDRIDYRNKIYAF